MSIRLIDENAHLRRELAEAKAMLEVARDEDRRAENVALTTNAALAEAQRQLREMGEALKQIAIKCSTFPIKEGLAFDCESIARAALASQQDHHE